MGADAYNIFSNTIYKKKLYRVKKSKRRLKRNTIIHINVYRSLQLRIPYTFSSGSIFAILTPQHWRWASFMGFNNLFISGTLAFILYICYG